MSQHNSLPFSLYFWASDVAARLEALTKAVQSFDPLEVCREGVDPLLNHLHDTQLSACLPSIPTRSNIVVVLQFE